MVMMNVGILQYNPTVGAIRENVDHIIEGYLSMTHADIVVTSELATTGYPPQDLLHRDKLYTVQKEKLDDILDATEGKNRPLVFGMPRRVKTSEGLVLRNSAVVAREGEIVATYDKRLLPTYDVFDEHRYFTPEDETVLFEHDGSNIGIVICEDAWHDVSAQGIRRHDSNPIQDTADFGADVILNLSASPFSRQKQKRRIKRFSSHADEANIPIVFANQVGANDELVFDGRSFVMSSDGIIRYECEGFTECSSTVDVFTETKGPQKSTQNSQTVKNAIVLGIKDYFDKTGFESAIVGMSGGIDSSLTAALVSEAIGNESVYGVTLPAQVTSQDSVEDAEAVANNLDIEFDAIPILSTVTSIEDSIESESANTIEGIAHENVQARARGTILMSLANSRDSLVVTPDNKSEGAVGYCTLYGDTVGAIAPLGDCYKELVYTIAGDCYGDTIPDRVFEKKPTAELSEDQNDEDDLPQYETLDELLERTIENEETLTDTDVQRDVQRQLFQSEFKRNQSPPIVRVTNRSIGRGWNYPIAADFDDFVQK